MASSNQGSEPYRWRLPRLHGGALAAYRLIWLFVFAAALATIAYFNPRDELSTIRLITTSYALDYNPYSNLVTRGLLGSPLDEDARRAGFQDGDLLLAVDGRPMPRDRDGQIALLSGPPGSIATLTLEHTNGDPFTVRIARDPERIGRAYAGSGLTFASRRWFAFAVRTLAAVAALAAAALLFVRRPRDPLAQLLSFSLVLDRAVLPAVIPHAPDILIGLQPLVANLMLSLAILLFPDRRLATRWHGLALATVIGANALQLVLYLQSWAPNWATLPFLLPPAAILIAVARQLRLTPPGIERQQGKFVLFGIVAYAVFLILGILLATAEALPVSTGTQAWIILIKFLCEALGGVAIPAGLLVSLLRYRLYDAETAISRSVAYGALTLALIAIFAGSEKIIEVLGEEYFGEHLGALAGGLGAAIAAVMIAPLHHRVTKWAERRFQGNLIHLRHGLPLLVGDMRETATPAALAEAMLGRVEKGVRAAHGAVVAGGEVIGARDIDAATVRGWIAQQPGVGAGASGLRAVRSDPVFPMRVALEADGVGLVGWLLLGPRPDGSFYGKDECETLIEIADPVARALAIAIEREQREAARRLQDAALESRIDALSRFIREQFGVDVARPPQPC